ncbi:SIR2 family protein [Fibrisoma montanum]|uniref:SIR2 family protein n=1 Tax=Fibrisoma montanum TaxID=2305895 RepID=A0A418LW76_9BACT|nr:SIR2 family protein [Fibrisoma montanum]RIV17491.1 SIR2 family protein [Fibrisoma montanum]
MAVTTLQTAEFIRIFSLRGQNIAWFTGAGASVAAGLPSAYDMTWDFKRSIFCTEQNTPISQYSNLTPGIKSKIQSYFNSQRTSNNPNDPPLEDSLDEYSYYFQRAYPDIALRSEYIERKLANAKPTYGYKVMAVLMRMSMLRFVLTTNFDRLIEDAAALAYESTSKLHVASIDNNYQGLPYIQGQRTPALLKLHGDFHSLFMKNTVEELQQQDEKLRLAFKNTCENYGFAFIGYSGRDNSIMEVLEEALKTTSPFPAGIFWFVRTGNKVIERVASFLEAASTKGVSTYLVEIESFEECFSSIIKFLQNVPEDSKKLLENSNRRLIHQPIANKGKHNPILRLNALEIKDYPSIARLIECECGNTKEILEAVKQAKANILCIRKQQGVVGFGDDREFDRVFPKNRKSIYPIEEKHFSFDDSSIKNLVTEALLNALTRNRPLRWIRKRSNYYIVLDPRQLKHKELDSLNNLTYSSYNKPVKHATNGYIPDTRLQWVDALHITITRKQKSIYLVLEPTIRVARVLDTELRFKSAAFVKEAMAKRLNGPYNLILQAWIEILFGSKTIQEKSFYSFGELSGIDASFTISNVTSFSRYL